MEVTWKRSFTASRKERSVLEFLSAQCGRQFTGSKLRSSDGGAASLFRLLSWKNFLMDSRTRRRNENVSTKMRRAPRTPTKELFKTCSKRAAEMEQLWTKYKTITDASMAYRSCGSARMKRTSV